MRMKINPDNPTEAWFTFDQREPSLEDHDFGADFYWKDEQMMEVITGVSVIEKRINKQ